MFFLSIEKYFDTFDHDIILQKLKYYGIDGHELAWFKNHSWDRKQYVRVDNITSDITSCLIGVPQVCNIYVVDAMKNSFWQMYSRNRIKSALCTKLTYPMVFCNYA